MTSDEFATALVQKLRDRAEALRKQHLHYGDYNDLRPREEECRAIAEMIERGRLL